MPADFTEIVKLLSGLGAVGVLAWLVWHLFKVEMPRRDKVQAETIANYTRVLAENTKDFREALADQHSQFRQELAEQRAEFRDELDEHRKQLDASVERMATSIERVTAAFLQTQR